MAAGSENRPEQIHAGREAQRADHEHPYAGDDVYAAFGEGADASPLAAPAAQEGVEAEEDAGQAHEDEQDAEGEGGGHGGV